MWYDKTRFTSYEIWVASYELRVESLKAQLKVQLKFKSTCSNPRVTSSNPRVTSSNPRVQESLNQWKLK